MECVYEIRHELSVYDSTNRLISLEFRISRFRKVRSKRKPLRLLRQEVQTGLNDIWLVRNKRGEERTEEGPGEGEGSWSLLLVLVGVCPWFRLHSWHLSVLLLRHGCLRPNRFIVQHLIVVVRTAIVVFGQ